jgi:hypothetical protein
MAAEGARVVGVAVNGRQARADALGLIDDERARPMRGSDIGFR